MDYAQENYKAYIGRHISELPTPALVVSLPLIKRNIQALHEDVEKLGIGFRPHIKTLKSLELTRMMLAGGKYRSIVASTLCEIHGALPLVKEGVLDECIYGLPVYPGIIPRLAELRASIRILLMVDCEQQITALEKAGFDNPWDVFIKLDVGTHRAGVMYNSSSLNRLVKRAEASSAVRIHGFYCHAGHSYGGRSRSQAEDALGLELSSALDAAKLLPDDRELIVSIGSTPTAHVVQSLKALAPANVKLELHAGNFPCNDLQQVSTGLVSETDQAVRLAAEVCSIYPDRNEALINAGVIALSRETSAYPGFGKVVEHPSWSVVRLSQEHGILGIPEGKGGVTESVEDVLEVGKKITLYVNHTCMTAAAAHVYFVVDENDVVREGWVPWKGW